MPWFYFHLRGPKGLERDDTGLDLAGIEAAYLEAYRTVPGLGADLTAQEMNPARYAFEITDGSDLLLMEVPFAEVLDRGRKPVSLRSTEQKQAAAVQMARAAYLINALREEHAATRDKLAETFRLLASLRPFKASSL